MTITQIKQKIIDWVKTGIPKNIKSYNMRTLLQEISKKLPDPEVYEANELYALGKDETTPGEVNISSTKIKPVQFSQQSLNDVQQKQVLENIGIKTIVIEGKRFFFLKKPGNNSNNAQAGDIATLNFNDSDEFKILEYVSGNQEAFASWKVNDNGNNGFQPTWFDMEHVNTVVDFPAMNKNEVKVIRILNRDETIKPDGWATIGGNNGIKVSNYAFLICMADSAGGTYASVGYKYAIVGNNIPASEVIPVPSYANLPNGVDAILGAIYLTIDTGNIYFFDGQLGNYVQIGSVIEGKLISKTVFNDTNNNPVVPDGTHLYKDIVNTPEKYYKWNGVKYVPFRTQGTFAKFIDLSDVPDSYHNHAGKAVVVNSSEDGLEFEIMPMWDSPTDKKLGRWDNSLQKIVNSKVEETLLGIKISGQANGGLYIAKTKKGNISGDTQLKEAEHFIYTMTGNVNFKFADLSLADDESAVFTIQLTGQFAFSFPAGVVAQPYNDTYNGAKTNYITVVITETVSGAIKGYYNLITAA